MKSLYKILLLIVLGLFLVNIGYVAATIGITIAPVKYKFEADPGQTIESSITVSNPNEFSIKVRPEFQDFKVTENNNIQWLPSDIDNPYKMSDWIKIKQDVISLNSKEELSTPFKIEVPLNAMAGGKYAAIFFTGVMEESGEGNIGAIPRVGALVILNVKGELERTGQLLSFVGSRFVNNGPVDFTLSFLNTGTTHYETKADFTVKNFFWKSDSFSSETKFVYPNIKRDFKATWERKNLLGIYTVTAKIPDGEGNIYEKSKIVVGFPYRYLLILIGVLTGLFYLYRWFKKKFKIVRV